MIAHESPNQLDSRLAIDIETISPNHRYWEKPNFRDSHDFEILAVALAYQEGERSDVQAEVLFRDGWGAESELDLIEKAAKRAEALDASTYLTYNGEAFDYPHLRGRARIAANELGASERVPNYIDAILSSAQSDDLKHDVWDAFGDYTTLEDACALAGISVDNPSWDEYGHGLEADDFRPNENKGISDLLGSDVAQFGEYYLDWHDENRDDARFDALETMLRDYAISDVVPLFQLADARPFE